MKLSRLDFGQNFSWMQTFCRLSSSRQRTSGSTLSSESIVTEIDVTWNNQADDEEKCSVVGGRVSGDVMG
jgi:hypothetical protein